MKQQLAWLPVSAVVGLATALVLLLGLGRSAPAQASPDTLLCVQAGNPNCFFTIGGALAAAHAGDTIKVAAGTYIEFVTITQTVTLQGGWNAQLTQRDPLAFPSIILPPSVSFSVVYIHGVFGNTGAVAPTLDGFTIQGGGGGNHGGGLRIVNSNAIVSHNVISGNVGYLLGGGVWVQNGAPVLSDNTIANNRVIPSGSPEEGGVELENTQATLTHNLIAGNAISASAGYGGGVAIEGGGPVTLTNNTIIGNVAATITSTASPTLTIDVGVGGGIYVANAPVQLTGNVVQSNAANGVVASGSGGAFGYGGGIDIVNSPAFTLTSNTS